MASKKYMGKVCAYCAVARSTTADHVVGRGFFPRDLRADLPQVPACEQCNARKASIEHYLVTLLPFGSGHPAALTGQADVVRRRLAKNQALRRKLEGGIERIRIESPPGQVNEMFALPIEGAKYMEYLGLIVRGLVCYHWKEPVPADYELRVMAFSKRKFTLLEAHVLNLGQDERVSGNYADGAFVYTGTSAPDDRGLTTWKINLYGDLFLVWPDDSGANHRLQTAVMTGPPELAPQLDWFVEYGRTT